MSDQFNIVLGNPQQLDEEARLARYRRAAEILNEAGWLWDEYMADQNRALLGTSPGDVTARETAYANIRVAAEMKAQAEIAVMQQKAAAEIEIQRMKAQAQIEIDRYKAGLDAQLKGQEMQHEAQLATLETLTKPQPASANIPQQTVR